LLSRALTDEAPRRGWSLYSAVLGFDPDGGGQAVASVPETRRAVDRSRSRRGSRALPRGSRSCATGALFAVKRRDYQIALGRAQPRPKKSSEPTESVGALPIELDEE
jgi:hypothetical protein